MWFSLHRWAAHEGWFTKDGTQFWVADRARDTITISNAVHGGVIANVNIGARPQRPPAEPAPDLAAEPAREGKT